MKNAQMIFKYFIIISHHSCSDLCAGIYPLQSESHICGIVAIVMSALFAWTENFTHMAHFSYLASPSIYNEVCCNILVCKELN